MAVYQFSALADGQAISFNPSADQLNFDQTAISAAALGIAIEGANLRLTAAGKSIVLNNTALTDLAGANVTFANGSVVRVGDNSVGVVNDHNANSLAGGAGADLLMGLGGNDSLNGGSGNDWLSGGSGNDTLTGSGGQDMFAFSQYGAGHADLVTDFAGNNWDSIRLDASTFTAIGAVGRFASGDVRFWVGTAAHDADDRIIYNSGTGQLWYDADGNGPGSAELIATLSTRPSLVASDIWVFAPPAPTPSQNQTIDGTAGNDTLAGGSGDDTLNGHAGNDQLTGAGGRDVFAFSDTPGNANSDRIVDFASGTDRIQIDGSVFTGIGASGGFSTNDARFYAANFDGYWGYAHDATDRLVYDTSTGNLWYDADGSGVTNDWAGQLPVLVATLQGAPALTAADIVVVNGTTGGGSAVDGASGNDSLVGTSGNDTLSGGDGNDTLLGLAGNDILDGGFGDDSMLGGDGNDSLFGGYSYYFDQSFDTMDGGLGDDTYVLERELVISPFYDSSGDIVLRDAGGTDTIISRSGYWTLGAGFENLELFNGYGEGGTLGIGNELDNVITAHSSWYVSGGLDGADGDDTLIGGDGRDTFQFAAGSGNYGHDLVIAGGDEDTLDFTAARSGVTVDFRTGTATGGGTDGSGSVSFTGIDFVNGGDFNDLLIAGDARVDDRYEPYAGPGLYGGAGDDTLLGGAVNDRQDGGAGNDEIRGGGENDTIWGGGGDDRLFGDAGNDLFILANVYDNGWVGNGNDTVDGGTGIDEIRYGDFYSFGGLSGVVADLAAGTSFGGEEGGGGSIHLSGIENFTGTSYADQITGDGGANVIDGNGGGDAIHGGGGDDLIYASRYYGAPAGRAQLFGDAGNDEMHAASGDDLLDGGSGNDSLEGSDGDDTLIGSAGQDTLTGGWGDDQFVLNAAPGVANADLVNDFGYGGADKIHLDALVMTALGTTGNFAPSDARFYAAAGATAGHDADDRVIFNTSTHQLFYDADGSGSGAAQLIVTVNGNLLTATDMVVDNGTPPSGGGSVINGTGSADTIVGTSGNDTIYAGGGNDSVDAAAGNDLVFGGGGNDTLFAGPGDDALYGEAGNNMLYGGAGNDSMVGGDGIDNFTLDWDSYFYGNDSIDGGAGFDYVHAATGTVLDLAAGTMVNSGFGQATLVGIEGAGTGDAADRLSGDAGANYFFSGAGDDTLDGRDGADTFQAWTGNDSIVGGAGSDWMSGDDGDDILIGGLGFDQVYGGAGVDSFVFDVAPATASADAWQDFTSGVDKVHLDARVMAALGVSGNFSAGDERFYAAAFATEGHDATDRVIYNTATRQIFYDADGNGAGAAQLIATLQSGATLAATDIVVDNGTAAAPGSVINGGPGNDSLVGGPGNDTINGFAGNDTIDGGPGADSMVGGAGNDLYFVDDTADLTVEAENAGIDEVRSNASSYTLGDWVNNLTLVGGVNGTGNAVDNVMVGNGLANVLNADGGNDTLSGGTGNDTLTGGVGNDVFLFNVTPNGANWDNVTDFASGVDKMQLDATVMTALGSSGTLAASDARFYSGSGVVAHDADDRLIYDTSTSRLFYDADGNGAGVMQLVAFLQPSATLLATDIQIINGTSGGSAGQTITGTSANDSLTGGLGNDSINGGSGNDSLAGSAGNDTLTGSGGQDTFVFREFGAGNADRMTDFATNWDRIQVDDAAFTAAGAAGRLAAGDARFFAGTAAHDADDRFVFNGSTGQLYYDADGSGSGAAQLIATVQAGATVAAADITVI